MAQIGLGINKVTVIKAQSGLGVPATGSGGQVLRRVTSVAKETSASYATNEILSHNQSTGVQLGSRSTEWALDGELSPGTYSTLLAALLRKAFTATTASTGNVTVTSTSIACGTADFLTNGFKIGDVARITAGTFANAVNRDNNFLVTGVTAGTLTGVTVNGTTLIAEGPIAAATVTVVGKKSIVPLTGHTDTLFTVEEWQKDIAESEVFPDMRIGKADVSIPASGNATIKFEGKGLGVRTLGTSQVLTTPTAETTTPVLTSARGILMVNGVESSLVTSASFSVDGTLAAIGPVVGSNFAPDMSRGKVMVSGTFSVAYEDHSLSTLFSSETKLSLTTILTADNTNAADFTSFTMSAIKLTGDSPTDGEAGIIRTFPFTAEINNLGGAALANDKTIITVQDSAA